MRGRPFIAQTATRASVNLILTVGRFDRLTSLTKYSLLAAPRLPSPVSPAEHSAPLGRRVSEDKVLIPRSSPLQQLMITYQLLQQQAGRRGATLQHVDSVGIGMLWACWHAYFLASRCLRTSYMYRLFVHVGLD